MVDSIDVVRPPLDALIVASWFPASDDHGAGRFIADQAEALLATGVARPWVISFEGSRLSGGITSRERQLAAILEHTMAGTGSVDPLFVRGAVGVDRELPVVRLPIPEGRTPNTGVAHAAAHRLRVLDALADRIARPTVGSGTVRTGIVHAHTAYPDGAAAIVLADRLGWPLIVTEHASSVGSIIAEPTLRERYAAVLARADRMLAVSDVLATELRDAFPEQADSIAVVPNAVPVGLFRPAPLVERTPDELLFVGYRKATKGIENLLRAFALAHGERPTLSLRLIGGNADADEDQRWRDLAGQLGIRQAVSFEGPRDRAGIADAMARASLFVHPSPRETFGVVAVEALASGLPVVATDSGGVSEILGPEPERWGALVAVDDPVALARAILATLERRETFDPADLRASVERRFGSASVAQRLLALYDEAIEGNTHGDAGRATPIAPRVGIPAIAPSTVIVGLDRRRLVRQLAPLPDDLRRTLLVVTAGEPADVALPSLGRIVEVAIVMSVPSAGGQAGPGRAGILGRLGRLAADPRGALLRRFGRGTAPEPGDPGVTEAVERLIATIEGPVELLPLDGRDHLSVEPIDRAGRVTLAFGGVRRLADIWNGHPAEAAEAGQQSGGPAAIPTPD